MQAGAIIMKRGKIDTRDDNCAMTSNPLSSLNARNILVQSRDRRDMASRVLPASADIQAEEQASK